MYVKNPVEKIYGRLRPGFGLGIVTEKSEIKAVLPSDSIGVTALMDQIKAYSVKIEQGGPRSPRLFV